MDNAIKGYRVIYNKKSYWDDHKRQVLNSYKTLKSLTQFINRIMTNDERNGIIAKEVQVNDQWEPFVVCNKTILYPSLINELMKETGYEIVKKSVVTKPEIKKKLLKKSVNKKS